MRSERFIAQVGLGAALLVFIPCMIILLVYSGSIAPSSVLRPMSGEGTRDISKDPMVGPAFPPAVMGNTIGQTD